MPGLRVILRQLRTLFWTALTLVTVLAAMLVGIGKLLMPYSDRYQPQLEAWLSQEFGQPVRIESFTGEWKAFGPRISLQGVTFLGSEGSEREIAIQSAALDVKPLNSLLPGRPFYSFHIIGADLALLHAADGRWELSGLGVSGRGREQDAGSGVGLLAIVGELRLEESVLSFTDEDQDLTLQFAGVRGRLQLNGPEIAAEIQAHVTDQARNRVLGDVEATLLMQLDADQRLAGARWHAKARELMISELVRQVPRHPVIPRGGWLNTELWGEWSRSAGQHMQGVLDVRDLVLPEQPRGLTVDHLNARFNWSFEQRKVWRIDLSEFEIEQGGETWGTDRLSIARDIPGDLGIWVTADFLDVGFPLALTQRIMSLYGTPWPRNVPRQAAGQISDFDLVLDRSWKLFLARGRFQEAHAWDWDRWPDVDGVSGTVALHGGAGQIEIGGVGVVVDWPRNFRRPATIDIPACTLEVVWGTTWQIDSRDCQVRNEIFDASGRLRFAKNEGRPALDINTVINRANLAELDDFWPATVMRPPVRNWLSGGLVSGQVTAGRFVMRGDMDDWPFSGHEGLLEAVLAFQDADLDYYPGWPRAMRLSGSAHFLGTAMEVEAAAGSLAGVPVRTVRGRIENLRAPALSMEYATQAPLPDLAGFIRATPLLDRAQLDLEPFLLAGDAEIHGRLTVPLKSGETGIALQGGLELQGNGFTEQRSGFRLTDITGTLSYDRDGLTGERLQAGYRGHAASLSIQAGWTAGGTFESALEGTFPIGEVLPETVLEGEPLLQALEGQAAIRAVLSFEPPVDDGPRDVWLDLSSDLSGVAIGLPPPLSKPAADSWPTRVRFPIRAAEPVCTVTSADRLGLAFDVPEGFERTRRASFRIGPGAAELPEPGRLRIVGEAPMLDLDSWIRVLRSRFADKPGMGRLQLEGVELKAADLRLLNRAYEDVALRLDFSEGVLSARVDSERLSGDIRYSTSEDGSHSLSAQLDRLVMPDAPADSLATDQDPRALPELHIYVKDFRYLDMALGETRIEAYPRQQGFRFAAVEANSPDFTFNARGDWIRDEVGERSDFDIVMTSESLGSLMHALEISSVLEGGQTMVRYDASWPGPPAAFALARLNGEIEFSVIEGTIVNADAGAGRMVGLMSVTALPRRLALDFRDVFGTGFVFDQASGTVTLENGVAYTDDMELTSTVASMEITGSSDLDQQTFDYILSVKPGVGQTLPVIGAIAGGPGGAAAGLALQGLLQNSLGEAAEARYSITGTWKEPNVVRIPLGPETESRPNE